ncbi:MAG: 3'-5' exonuclease domain-containing protein 2 [Prevotella sp.]|nr:3'-5' exonuclease domain-containing protein 2 [Prevotella sp.]
MPKTIYNKYDKSLIASLPVAEFGGRIIVVLTAGEARRAVDFLLSRPVLGLDTETRPSFSRGHQHLVSLLQVATDDICFLFRLNYMGLTPDLVRLLEDTTVDKVGLSWHDDLNSLRHLGSFKPGRFIEIQEHVRQLGIEDLSLQKIYANLFSQKISKRQQLSNWEADVLSDRQKMYAATDAWACIKIYREIMRLKAQGDYELIIKKEDNDEASNTEAR